MLRSVPAMARVAPPMAEGHSPTWADAWADTWMVSTGNRAAMSIQVRARLWAHLSAPRV